MRFVSGLNRKIAFFYKSPVLRRRASVLASLFAVWLLLRSVCYFITESQWFGSMGYGSVWWRHTTWTVGGFMVALGLALPSLGIALRAGGRRPPPLPALPPAYQAVELWIDRWNRRARPLLKSLVIVVALVLALRVAQRGSQWAFFFKAVPYGDRDPFFGLDASFYIFRLPALRIALTFATSLTSWTIVLCLLANLGRVVIALVAHDGTALLHRIGRRLALLAAIAFFLRALGFLIGRLELVWTLPPVSETTGLTIILFYGRSILHLLGFLACLLGSILILRFVQRRRMAAMKMRFFAGLVALWVLVPLLSVVLAFAAAPLALLGAMAPFDAAFREKQRLSDRAAWQLKELTPETQQQNRLEDQPDFGRTSNFDWVRLWSEEALHTHASGETVSLDRYQTTSGHTELVGISSPPPRPPSGGWFLRHVAGAAPASRLDVWSATEAGADGLPSLLGQHPLFEVKSKTMFFPAQAWPYALTRDPDVHGVNLGMWWRRMVWAIRLGDLNLLLQAPAGNVRGAPLKLLFRRTARETGERLAPLLTPGGTVSLAAPLPVVANGRLWWMMDLPAATDSYPGAPVVTGERTRYNSLADSVKMVMDSATGEVGLYAASMRAESHPMLRVVRSEWPSLIRSYSAMPEVVRRHRRYSQLVFKAQIEALGLVNGEANGIAWQPTAPQYGLWPRGLLHGFEAGQRITNLAVGDSRFEFLLQSALTRVGESRPSTLIAVSSEGAEYGRLHLWRWNEKPRSSGSSGSGVEGINARAWRGAAWLVPSGEAWRSLWFEPLYSAARPSRLLAVQVGDTATGTVVTGATRELALDTLRLTLRSEEKPDAALPTGELAARALALQTRAQLAAKRGEWSQWSQLMQRQRAVLELLKSKLP
jgi:uncharacterized membrane protein (UPF0182 family)